MAQASDTTHVAVITGASRGLGLALARALAERGWTLIIDARGAEALEDARHELAERAEVIAIPGDVTDPAHRRALAEAAERAGGVDAIVNNASILGPSPQPRLLDYPLETLEAVYRANVIAPLGVIQALAPHFKPAARILNITSDAAVEPYEGWGGYGSSKAALEQLTHILAAELPDLRVFWADPGDMRTQMHQEAFPGEDISDRPLPEVSAPGLLALLTGDYPSGRYRAREVLDAPAAGDTGDETSGVREVRVALTVEDFPQAVAHYRDGLNLPVVKHWETPEGRGMILDAGRGTIELLDRADAAFTDQQEVGARVAGPVRLALEVADVERAALSLAERSARVVHAPIHATWGVYSQRVQAPDGMQITLFTPEEG